MIVNISADESRVEDALDTLAFASAVKEIRTHARPTTTRTRHHARRAPGDDVPPT